MKLNRKAIIRGTIRYYVKAWLFIIASYGMMHLLYGNTRISFIEWAAVMLIAFTIAYIPSIVSAHREK